MRDATMVFTRIVRDFGGTPASRRALEGFLGGVRPTEDDPEDADLFGD